MMNDSIVPSLLVKFRFIDEKKSEIALLTFEQYSNIKDLPITKECKIVKNEKPTLSKRDVAAINKKIASLSKSHTQTLSE
ncbi:hypothetical protein C6990_02820 [Nitrosopumilus sp. b3]|uniref:hypothetical protein n=1 Tax=Nitrosopumilus sp. b3 TaxID=2109909 RepID=UPI0015F6D083|nr:hypothetical protein [Nitrosopumilus sp. b3]KAF6247415.1 hypothetical protein C6990_02820 [Nitrosopumilus sp. b3]